MLNLAIRVDCMVCGAQHKMNMWGLLYKEQEKSVVKEGFSLKYFITYKTLLLPIRVVVT